MQQRRILIGVSGGIAAYKVPELVRVLRKSGHLVRCGHSSATDVNFGREVGGAAVLLLKKGISGKTVVGVEGDTIHYMETSDAIKQRQVDLDLVRFHENLGICFGRPVEEAKMKFLTP